MSRRQRREINKNIRTLFDQWRANSKKYAAGDPFNTIETIETYEPGDDEPADVIVAIRTLEHLTDVDTALQDIKRLAKKSAAFLIEPDALRGKEAWREIIGRYFQILDMQDLPGNQIWVICSRATAFGLDKVVAAGTPEGRWDNIIHNCRLISKRVQRAPANDKTAIIACYGPSLGSNLVPLVDECKDPSRILVSVSGSHDFLIDRGIKPDFHIECDPRPHKADNIAKGLEGVQYLLGSVVHPVLMDKLKGFDVSLWHSTGEYNWKIVDELEPNAWFVGAMGNVGLASLPLLHATGIRKFSVYGMDCSFTSDGEKWAGAHAQKKNPAAQQEIIEVLCGGRTFLTQPIYLTYATAFFDVMKMLPDAEFTIRGDSLLQAMCQISEFKIQTEAA